MMLEMHKPLVVEFLGLPGAGKTFLQSAVIEHLRSCSLKVRTREDMFSFLNKRNKIKAVLLKPWFILRFLSAVFFSSNISLFFNSNTIHRVKYAANYPLYINLYIKVVKPDVLILDRASAQNLWSLWVGRNKPPKNLLIKLFQITHKVIDNKYVFIKIDAKTAADRIMSRPYGKSRFDSINESKTIQDVLAREVNFIETLCNTLEKQSLSVIKLRGRDKSKTNITKLTKWFFSMSQCENKYFDKCL